MSTPSPLEAIFFAALEKESPAERAAYLDEACGDDPDLRERIERMLTAQAGAGSFLEVPAGEINRSVHQPLTEKPGTQIGRYKLLQQIGEGGMGVVYMAEQTEPVERRVALKIIKPGMDTRRVIARFEAERQALALMDHPNIAKVLDAGATESGRPYFVMELVKGTSITQYCDEHQLSPRERLELFVPVCQAVQHAHQKGVIHRDIKPSNVLVAEYDERPVPKIIDFGVAKAIDQRLTEKTAFTEFGQVVGTIDYMSPEQAKLNQLDVDTRSDIYSLGVLLYELLTGETPFDPERLRSAAFDELLRIIREEEPPRPSLRLSTSETLPSIAANRHIEPKKLSTLVRGELDWIVMKALEKDRSRRYETATSFSADIERYLCDEPVQACPPSAAYRFRKFARRNKIALSMVAVASLLLLLGVVSSIGYAIRRQQMIDDLKNVAESSIAEARLAIANAQFAEAKSRVTEVRTQLASEESLLAEYDNELADILREAESQLQFRNFQVLAEDARFAANKALISRTTPFRSSEKQVLLLEDTSRMCRKALGVFNVLEDDQWIDGINRKSLTPDQRHTIKASTAELLCFLARIEFSASNYTNNREARIRHAVSCLDRVENLASGMRSLYEYRSEFLQALGEVERSLADARKADEVQPTTWLDHFLLGVKATDTDLDTAVRHLQSALALRSNDYWCWSHWSFVNGLMGRRDLAYFGADTCTHLRPNESESWRQRGWFQQEPGAAMADFTVALEMAHEREERGLIYASRGTRRLHFGDLPEALSDLDQAIRLMPNFDWLMLQRATVHQLLGHDQKAREDAETVLRLAGSRSGGAACEFRISALCIVGRVDEAKEEAAAFAEEVDDPDWKIRVQNTLSMAIRQHELASSAPEKQQTEEQDDTSQQSKRPNPLEKND